MKYIRRRGLILILLTLSLLLGLGSFAKNISSEGETWVSFFSDTALYSSGSIYDRNDILLYENEGLYAEDERIRTATMHLVNTQSVGTALTTILGEKLSSYHPILGTSFSSHDLYLTIDGELSAVAYEALDGKKGAVSLYNYETGELLVSVSAPSFDLLDPPEDTDTENYEGVFLNRCFSSTFTPGSIFKILTTLAYVDTFPKWEEANFHCDGEMIVGGEKITCSGTHGDITLGEAFSLSCNCAYATMALELGGDTLYDYAQKAGLLENFSLDGITIAAGNFDISPDNSGSLAWSGIGQSTNLVNPISFLRFVGALANNGTAISPFLLKNETFADSNISLASTRQGEEESIFSPETCENIKSLMADNMAYYDAARFGDLEICAKTGTAELGGDTAPHTWFAGFLLDENHPYAFVILVEEGVSGSKTAGDVAAALLTSATN